METAAAQLTYDDVLARVVRELEQDRRDGRFAARLAPEAVERTAMGTVADLWPSRVRAFVPLLALRLAREALRRAEPLAGEDDAMPTRAHPAQGPAIGPTRWPAYVVAGGTLSGALLGRALGAEDHGAALGGLVVAGVVVAVAVWR